MATIDQMITVTPLDTTLDAFDISAQSLISVIGINSDANSSVKYVDNNRHTQIIKVDESPSDIADDAENLLDLTVSSTGGTIYVNVSKIMKMFENGTGTQIVIDSEKAAYEPIYVDEAMADIQTSINALADTTPIPLAQHITDDTQSTSTTSGAFRVDGGVGIVKNAYIGGLANVAGAIQAAATTDATTKDTGSIVTEGGIGVEKSVFVGASLTTVTSVISNTIAERTAASGVTVDGALIKDGSFTGKQATATATAAGLTTGALTGADQFVTVTSASANDVVCLPAEATTPIGTVIRGWVGANGFELRPIAAEAATTTINNVTTDVEAAIPATTKFKVEKVAANTWLLTAVDELGAVIAAIVPDAI